MGVTIHFEGQLKSPLYYSDVLKMIETFAQLNNMNYEFFDNAEKTLLRVKNEDKWDYHGPTKGIKIQPHVNSDPLWIEFDKDYYIQDFCKTQFVDQEIHIKIIELLKSIEPFFENLLVTDEGEYWSTNDLDVLKKQVEICFKAMEDAKQENPKLSGPYRVSDGRIVDFLEDRE
jgi:hypothetical protein